MADGKHCPKCGKAIGFWPVFSAGMPDRIFCPHCKARLRYRNAFAAIALLVILVVAVGAAMVGFVLWAPLSSLSTTLMVYGIAGAVHLFVLESLFTLYLQQRCPLEEHR